MRNILPNSQAQLDECVELLIDMNIGVSRGLNFVKGGILEFINDHNVLYTYTGKMPDMSDKKTRPIDGKSFLRFYSKIAWKNVRRDLVDCILVRDNLKDNLNRLTKNYDLMIQDKDCVIGKFGKDRKIFKIAFYTQSVFLVIFIILTSNNFLSCKMLEWGRSITGSTGTEITTTK